MTTLTMGKAALLLALITCLGASPARAGTTKSLLISATINETAAPNTRCPSFYGGTITGHGNSDIFGAIVFMAIDCIVRQGPQYIFSSGKLIIVTAAGHQIFANYSGQLVPGLPGNYAMSGATFQITGGLGAFVKATGGGTLQGSEVLGPMSEQGVILGVGNMSITGKVTY